MLVTVALAQSERGRAMSPEAARACREAGGLVRSAGLLQHELCIHTFKDAGHACSDGDQCLSGACLSIEPFTKTSPVSGRCAPDDDPFGCKTYLRRGEVGRSLCVD